MRGTIVLGLLTCIASPAAAVCLVQMAHNESGGTSTLSATFGNTLPPADGHLLVAVVGAKNGTIDIPSGWSEAIRDPASGSVSAQAIFFKRSTGVTADKTISVVISGGNTTITIQMYEYSGPDTSPSGLVGSNHSTGSGSGTDSTGVVAGAGANDLFVAGITLNDGGTTDGANGFTLEQNFTGGSSGGRNSTASADRTTNSSNFANSASFTHANVQWRAQIAAWTYPKLALSGDTTNLNSGTTRTLTATIKDNAGATVTSGSNSTLSVTFTQTGGTGSVTGLPSSVTAGSGLASINVTGNGIGDVTITASATTACGALAPGTGNPITFWVVAPTLVSFHSFSAVPQGGGVLLKWRSGREVSNLGYHVYRDGVRITRSPIAGSALLAGAGTVLTAGNSYSWFDPEGTLSSTYTIEDVDLNGIRTVRGLFYVDTAAGSSLMRAGGAVAETGSRTISELGRAGSSDGRWFTTSALESTGAAEVAAAAPATDSQTSQQYTLAAGQAVKLGVRQEGWYHVDASQLTAAGMPSSVNPRTLQLFVNGQQQDILVPEQGGHVSAVEFYGTGVDTTWSDTEVYWLRWGSQLGQRIQSQSGKGKGTAPTSFPLTVQWKPRVVDFWALTNGDADNYFGPILDATDPVTQSLPVTNLSAGTPGNSTLQVRMQGATAGTHVVGIQLNGNSLGSVTFQDQQSGVSSFSVPNASLAAGAALTLTALGGESDVTLVDTVALTYPHKYAADGDVLRLTTPSGPQVTITGFSNNQIRVMDVTDPANVTAPQGTVASQPGGSYSITVVPQGGGTRTLLAFTNASQPASVKANQPSSWHSAQAGADMAIISHGDFIPSLAPLVALRQSQGLKVAVVNVEDLYDEFNFGVLSPYAVKNFLANARTVWTRKPRWVLLVGDATNDPRDYFGLHQEDYVPVETVATTQLETASDDWFGDFNNDGIPEMFVGRLPVHAVSDAAALVAKIVAYDNAGAAAWKNRALLAAGTNDSDNNFESYIAAVQALLPPGMAVTDILQGSDPNAAADFLAAFNNGQGLVNFAGHGSTEIWKGDLFTSAAAGTVTNSAATPFVISMTCLNAYFADGWTFSLAEAVLEAPGGGAVGVWASSGLTESAAQATMNQAMIRALYGGVSITVGEAAVTAKRAISDQDVRRTWILFGDPAMKLR